MTDSTIRPDTLRWDCELKRPCVGRQQQRASGLRFADRDLFMIGMGLWMGAKALGWITL